MQPHVLTCFKAKLIYLFAFDVVEVLDQQHRSTISKDIKYDAFEEELIESSNDDNANDRDFLCEVHHIARRSYENFGIALS